MIPNLQPQIISNLTEWLVYELRTARSDRAPLESDWIRYAEVYRAKPSDKQRDFPFRGAANFTVPVAATDIDTTIAGLVGTIFGAPNLWSCEGLRPDWLDFAARLEEYLEYAQETELGMYSVVVDWITELTKLGTGILKQRYVREQKRVYEWRETQTALTGGSPQTLQQVIRRIVKDNPEVKRTPLANFYVPATANDIQEAPWCAERLSLTWGQLESRVRAGIYTNDFMAKIGAYFRAQQPSTPYQRYETVQQELDNFLPSNREVFELFEFWTDYDIDGTGEPVSVVCTIHEPTMSYARADYNPFFHQEKPYSVARFLRQEGRFYGIGLCEILEQIQDVVSALECQRLDNGTIRNTAIFKTRKGSGIREDEPIWPGRIFTVENMTDLEPMQMGYEAQPTLEAEQFILNYGQRRSGVSAYTAGGAGQPAISYSAATTTIAMLQQGRLRLDQALREIQSALSETGQRVVELLQQFNQGGKPYLVMGDKDGSVVEQVLTMPLDTIRLGVSVKVTATNSQLNRETKIRTDQIIYGLVLQFYQQLSQAMTVVVNPQVPFPLRQLMQQMIDGGTILMRRILDAYGTQDLDRIIPDLDALNATIQQLDAALPGGGGPVAVVPPPGAGGGPVGAGPGQPPWMAFVPGGSAGISRPGVPALTAGTGPQ